MTIILHDYWRSSAAYRVRIALNLKGLAYQRHEVDLIHGVQSEAENRARNPQGLVPTLEIDGQRLTQSLAICDYLDQRFPDPPLIPATAEARARVMAVALAIACEIHPLCNLRVLRYLKGPLGHDQAEIDTWYAHWIATGLEGVEALVAQSPERGRFVHGDSPGLADLCIVPQLYNARRFACDLGAFPHLCAIDAAASAHPAFAAAHPDRVGPSASA